MTKLKKCLNNDYTLKDLCPICSQKTNSAHYKFIKIRSAQKQNSRTISPASPAF